MECLWTATESSQLEIRMYIVFAKTFQDSTFLVTANL